MNKLDKIFSHTVKNGDCWEWTRCYNSDGYPRMGWNGHGNGKVHRIVMELLGHDIDGLVVRHKCDNPKCINPDHLVLGSIADNVKDMDERGRRFKKIDAKVVAAVKAMWETGMFSKKDVSVALGIDCRRVSEITTGKRGPNGEVVQR